MHIQRKIFPHTPRDARHRPMTRQSDLAFEVSEAVYEVFRETTTVAYQAAQRAYPREKRDQHEVVRHAYEAAHDEAKAILTKYKTLVRDNILPLTRLTKHSQTYDFHSTDFETNESGATKTHKYEDRPTWQMRAMIVLNAYFRLYNDLVKWIPPMPKEEAERYVRILTETYKEGRDRLLDFLAYYEADPVLPEDGSHINITH